MKITIVTAAFRAKGMDSVLESIKNQTFSQSEWIIINDNQEGIREWYKKNKANLPEGTWFIDLTRHFGRFGLFSRNVGAMLAANEHIAFLDDDNQWEPEHLESLAMLEDSNGKVPYCWMHYKGKKEGSKMERIKKTGFAKQGIDLGCILWRKSLLDQYGYFRNDSQVTFDWNCIARVYFGYGPHNFVCTEKPTLIFWHKRY